MTVPEDQEGQRNSPSPKLSKVFTAKSEVVIDVE